MFNKERWNEILEALNANRFRTFLTAFGVFWGILILIVLLALTKGLRNGVERDFGNFATNSIYMWGQGTSIPYKGLNKGRRVQFKIEDREILQEKIPELKYVSPRNQLGGYQGSNNVTRNEKTGAFNIYGDYPEFINQQPMTITAGRFISYSDINEKRKTCVIGKDVVKSLYDKGEKPVGSYIQINGVNFLVTGTFTIVDGNGDQEENSNTIYIPFTTFSQAFNQGNNVSWFVLTAQEKHSITTLKPQILSVMRGIIGISNIMLIVVKERTKEIGVRRALGATPFAIKSQILQEAMILTLLAGMLGVAAASGLIWLTNYALGPSGGVENFANPSVDIGVITSALIILVIAGILAGFIPASRATKMKPIDALRIE